MATKDDLDAAIAQVEGDVAAVATEMNAAFARLQAVIDAGGTAADLSAEVTNLTNLHASLLTAIGTAQAEAPAPVPAPVTPPVA